MSDDVIPVTQVPRGADRRVRLDPNFNQPDRRKGDRRQSGTVRENGGQN